MHMFYAIAISSMLTAGVLNGDKAVAFIMKTPTAEEIMATLPDKEVEQRTEYVDLLKDGHAEAAQAYAESKRLKVEYPDEHALAVSDGRMPAPTEASDAKAEKPESGNVQSPPLN
jgi:hypothetical protein